MSILDAPQIYIKSIRSHPEPKIGMKQGGLQPQTGDCKFELSKKLLFFFFFFFFFFIKWRGYYIHLFYWVQIPLFVATKILPMSLSSFLAPTPEEYSKACLRWIGYEPLCMPYWRHSLQGTLAQAIPAGFTDWVALKCFLRLRKIRKSKAMRDVMKRNSKIQNA